MWVQLILFAFVFVITCEENRQFTNEKGADILRIAPDGNGKHFCKKRYFFLS